MPKRLIATLIVLLPLTCVAQSTYDSLRKVYALSEIFTKRKELNISYSKYVSTELEKQNDPEMKQLATCAIAENLYGIPFLSDNELMDMVNSVLKKPVTEAIQSKATEIKTEFLRELVGSRVKPLEFATVTGDTIKLINLYTSGKDYVVIDFWATWCGPCIASMKKINALKEKYNIEVYSISLDDSMNKVQNFVAKNPTYTWPIVYGGKNAGLHKYFKIRAIPTYFLVNKDGLILSNLVGGDLDYELKKLYSK